MLSCGLQTRNGTLGGAHAGGNRILSEAGASARGQHFMSEGVFDFKNFIRLAEATTLRCFFKKRLVVMAHRAEFQISHF